MITTNTIPARACIGATIAALCFAAAACGSEQGTVPDRNSQHVAANDVAAQVDHRKAALSQDRARPLHAAADDVAAQVDHRKSAHGTH